MKQRKIIYSAIALSKRKTIKKEVKEKYGQAVADRVSDHIKEMLSKLKKFPKMGISMREQYGLDCEYHLLFIEHNYFIYKITDNEIMILEIFNEKEDFMYQLFGIVTVSQDTINYWDEE